MSERSGDWLRQAERDLSHAKHAQEDKDYEWVCFSAQQATEKALKAVYERLNKTARGHSIVGLLEGLKDMQISKELYSYARILSRYYIETRYLNGFPEGAPLDYFDEKLGREAIDAAEQILRWCRDTLSKCR